MNVLTEGKCQIFNYIIIVIVITIFNTRQNETDEKRGD